MVLSPDVRIEIARLEKRAAAEGTPEALAGLGVAYLVQGEHDRAIAILQDLVATDSRAETWSDLSAAFLVKAERVPGRRVEYFSRALEAASVSLRLQRSNEALFNRSLAVSSLNPYVGDVDAWADYLKTEVDQRWLAAARRHVVERPGHDEPLNRWNERRKTLQARLIELDKAYVLETARLFPEPVIELFDQEMLPTWAAAKRADDTAAARAAQRQALVLGESILAATGDPMPVEEARRLRTVGTVLAEAHLAYSAGVRALERDDYQRASSELTRASEGFAKAKSNYKAWADTQLATIQFHQRALDAADRQLTQVERLARARNYETLLGRALRLHGLVYSKQWRLPQALATFREAAAHAERAGQREYAVAFYSHLADTLRTLGEQQESWDYIGRTLAGLSSVRTPSRRYLFLYNAALFASSQDLLEAALLFQNATVREASKAVPGMAVDALTQRAVIHVRRGDRKAAAADLEAAIAQLESVPDGPPKTYLKAEIDVLASRLDHSPSSARRLEDAITFFGATEPSRVPGLFLNLAELRRTNQSMTGAEAALQRGIETLESQQSELNDEALKISYFGESWTLFQEMIALQLDDRRDPAKAFEYAERSRARTLLAALDSSERLEWPTLETIQSTLPPSSVLVYYATLPDRLLTWGVSPTAQHSVETPIREDTLNRLIESHRAAIADRRINRTSNDELYAALIRPIARLVTPGATLVLVPDGSLQHLPFATLRNPATGRFLLEDHAVLLTPSASFFTTARTRRRPDARALVSALLVGNPTTEIGTTPRQALPGAELEVSEAAKYYPQHTVLRGALATKERFLKAAPLYDVVHFGGHAFTNPEYPLLSRLSFVSATGAAEESLFAHEIGRLQFKNTRVVVLAACSTAVGAVSRGEGAVSVARPFLGAGVPAVVASQWDVDDRATQRLFSVFHRELSKTQDPSLALRTAQLALLHSGSDYLASPSSWGAFVVLGTTLH